ncbi:MAG TPA: TlpA disulfide reductase family protein [Rhizomicrobium sp.]|jgi:thiol-disulfide isomerase/thioredoxin
MMLDRRTVLAGFASLAAPGIAAAEDANSPIAHGLLAQNPLAQAFESAPHDLPDVTLYGPKGPRSISTILGRTILMPLWAEWCGPCLEELPDFARLQKKYGNNKFAIVPVLSGPRKRVSPEVLAKIFAYLHADVFEPLMEDNLGNQLMAGLARRRANEMEIPCNVLIAPDGHVVAREFGMKSNESLAPPAGVSAAQTKSAMIAQAEAGNSLSLWGKQPGDEFAQAMANGFLTG